MENSVALYTLQSQVLRTYTYSSKSSYVFDFEADESYYYIEHSPSSGNFLSPKGSYSEKKSAAQKIIAKYL